MSSFMTKYNWEVINKLRLTLHWKYICLFLLKSAFVLCLMNKIMNELSSKAAIIPFLLVARDGADFWLTAQAQPSWALCEQSDLSDGEIKEWTSQ